MKPSDSQAKAAVAKAPRGQAREDAILAATLELLYEKGYEGLSLDRVAARAQASKTTIYRRWPGKAELVKATLDALYAARIPQIPDTGSLKGDLRAALADLREQASARNISLSANLSAAMRFDSHLAELLREHILNDDLTPFAPVLQRAMARGELAASTPVSLIHEVGEALTLRRLYIGQEIDEPFVGHVIDDVLMPLLAAHLVLEPKAGPASEKSAQS